MVPVANTQSVHAQDGCWQRSAAGVVVVAWKYFRTIVVAEVSCWDGSSLLGQCVLD